MQAPGSATLLGGGGALQKAKGRRRGRGDCVLGEQEDTTVQALDKRHSGVLGNYGDRRAKASLR